MGSGEVGGGTLARAAGLRRCSVFCEVVTLKRLGDVSYVRSRLSPA